MKPKRRGLLIFSSSFLSFAFPLSFLPFPVFLALVPWGAHDFGELLGPLGVSLGPFGVLLGPPGLPLGALGCSRAGLGVLQGFSFLDNFWKKQRERFRSFNFEVLLRFLAFWLALVPCNGMTAFSLSLLLLSFSCPFLALFLHFALSWCPGTEKVDEQACCCLVAHRLHLVSLLLVLVPCKGSTR